MLDLSASCSCSNVLGPCEFHRLAIIAESGIMPMNMMMDHSFLDPKRSISEHFSDSAIGLPDMSPHFDSTQKKRSGRSTKTITSRFENLLRDVKAAGFKTFDEAVAAYYTQDFEASSAPDLAQKASRGRRLRYVLTEIEESSADWTFWEARGYRDKIIEAAEGIYLEEMTSLLRKEGSRVENLDLTSAMSLDDSAEEDGRASPAATKSLDKVYQNEVCTTLSRNPLAELVLTFIDAQPLGIIN